MRAPVQKMRSRRKGKQAAPEGATPGATTPTEHVPERTATDASVPDAAAPPVNKAPTARVRNRLIVAVAVVAAAVAGAGAPAVLAASGDLNDTQNLVTLAEQTQQAVSLGHSLADERDEVTTFIAAGRPQDKGLSESRSARVDRQIDELRGTDAPAGLRGDLADVAAVRRAALTGKSTALEAHEAYTKVIAELHGLTRDLAEKLPPEANQGALALSDLDHAVEQAAAARGLLLAALALPRPTGTSTVDPVTGLPTTGTEESSADAKRRDELSSAAQQARVRELAALADFRDAASDPARATYESTVTGSEVGAAEKYLERLTDQPKLSAAEQRYDRKKVDAALSARIETMRGAESALAVERTKHLAQLRDDDVTALEIRIALVGVCLLVAVGFAMGAARSLTRPLAVLRLGSARLATEPAPQEPIRFTGRDDEFAQVVRSVNALHGHAAALTERLATLESDRKHLIGQRQSMADERAALREELAEASAHLERVRQSIHGTFVNLALRTLGLVERQLAVIEHLEDREQDPDRLATLFKLDHLATVMRRHSENLLVLAGAEHGHQHPGAVPLVDVVRAAVSEIERYERVRIATLPPHTHVAGFAADDISHLTAELLENATSFSPPDSSVEVSGWLLENGEVMLSVQDEGIGVTQDRMRELNARLADFDPDDAYDQESGDGLGLGLYVVARLAARHGARVRLRDQKQGGIAAVVVLPEGILADAPSQAAVVTPPRPGEPLTHLPGSEAEANSNVLPGRLAGAPGEDPLIAAAERTLETALPSPSPEPSPGPSDEPDPDPEPSPSPETTMELAAPPAPEETAPEETAPEPKQDPEPQPDSEPEPEPDAGPAPPKWERVTDKGLPKRTPKITAPAAAAPKPRTGSVDAEALRRRLGNFHQGAISGRRDVEAEISGDGSGDGDEKNERAADVMGDPVEEASS
ncbi:nitrate- and nitrite sensing domain-containing protein [Streptomyces sp. Je 1-369]|uniref:nitrate- and nitrite sensing domain-containing protein n=1 Tax=Streptomyces sp. Je 1-369 TaxID=2966192 RepID=UPI00228618CE|nr:nitrate- and nitrite sensing domain-containing protein [Streptomyces sp. Je 1-369]WAL97830.1 nitrate- and nitrite sensing domain-containing protein [Streptomyces sp. Je 1-369]